MSGFDAFSAAQQTVDDIELVVQARINDATKAAEEARTVALDTISQLTQTGFAIPQAPPVPPKITSEIKFNTNLPPVQVTDFGQINDVTPQSPDLDTVPSVSSVVIPNFVSSIGSLTIPPAPDYSPPSLTAQFPEIVDPTIPTSPNVTLPALDALSTISIPAFTFPILPTFDAQAPTFDGSTLPQSFTWIEPTYHNTVLDETLVVIRKMYAGETGLPPAIEQAIFDRTNDREDQLVARAVSEVATEWSERGFQAPNGMLNKRIDMIREDSLLKKQGANRDLAIKIADIDIENLRFAVTQALACEQILVNIFLNSAQRMFEAAKYQVQALIEIYNAQIALFNARQLAYQTAATVFKVQLEAALSSLEVYKAQIQGELAKAQVNESIVRAYLGKVQALMSQVEIYKAQMQGAQLQVEVTKSRLDAYKTAVEAYATGVQAEKIKFDAYASEVSAEGVKANIISAQAQAYAAQIQGISTGVVAQRTAVEAVVSKNDSLIRKYIADIEKDKALMQFQLAGIQEAVAAYNANTQRFIAQAEADKAVAQLQISSVDVEDRSTIALYSAMTAAYNARMEQVIREASLAVEGLKSAGQIAATLAASAYAAVHVGATLSGQGSMSASGSEQDSYSQSTSTSTNTNYNYEGT